MAVWLVDWTKGTLVGLGTWQGAASPCVQALLWAGRGHTWTLERVLVADYGAGGGGGSHLGGVGEDSEPDPAPSQPPPSRKEVACCWTDVTEPGLSLSLHA